jgi:hypothetical protein
MASVSDAATAGVRSRTLSRVRIEAEEADVLAVSVEIESSAYTYDEIMRRANAAAQIALTLVTGEHEEILPAPFVRPRAQSEPQSSSTTATVAADDPTM